MNEQDENHESNDVETDVKIDLVKKRALQALAPLLGSLNTNPERKFEICMSALRFTDDKNLAEIALEAALSIEDNGPKAEALVELINEIDYLQKS
jgi:hypothetical protein